MELVTEKVIGRVIGRVVEKVIGNERTRRGRDKEHMANVREWEYEEKNRKRGLEGEEA